MAYSGANLDSKKILKAGGIISVALLVVAFVLFAGELDPVISSYDDCIAAGNQSLNTDPPTCQAGDKTFTKLIIK